MKVRDLLYGDKPYEIRPLEVFPFTSEVLLVTVKDTHNRQFFVFTTTDRFFLQRRQFLQELKHRLQGL